jgi:hypothetical protein
VTDERRAAAVDGDERVRIPTPVEDGGYDVESLGAMVDRLMGDDRVRARAAVSRASGSETEPAEDDDVTVEVPTPVPGGNEPVTREGPPAEG